MTLPASNLHGFVLNLLGNEAARSAFGADPAGALGDAGLQDITPQDVQDVLPLVLDHAPGMPGLDGGDAMQAMSAVQQLQTVAHAAETSPQAFSGSFAGDSFASSGNAAFDAAGHAAFDAEGASGSYTAGSPGAGSFSAGANAGDDGSAFSGAFTTPFDSGGQGGFVMHDGDATSSFSTASPLGEFELSFEGGEPGVGSARVPGGEHFALGSGAGGAAAGTVAGYVSSGGEGFEAFGDMLSEGTEMYGTPAAGTSFDSLSEKLGVATDDFAQKLPHNADSGSASARGDASAQQHTGTDAPAQAPLDAAPDLPGDLPTDLLRGAAEDMSSELTQNLPNETPDLPVANPLPEEPTERASQLDPQQLDPQVDPQVGDNSSGSGDLVGDSPVGGHVDQLGSEASDLLSSPSDAGDDLPF